MDIDSLIYDPVFQLNLLLWMAKEQPKEGYRVKPLFYEQGFKILYIENPFAFPVETAETISNSGIDISIAPEPDLLLKRTADAKALYLEAKSNSFGIESKDNSKQARGHLMATGPAFSEVYKPLRSCLLCYVLPENGRNLMDQCLSALTDELEKASLKPGKHSINGLGVESAALVYSWDSAFKDYLGITEDSALIIGDITKDTDPSPMLLVFSDEDCHNTEMRDFYRRVLLEQARARLLCDLHPQSIGTKYETTPDGLLGKTTDGIFSYLSRERQKGLRRLIRDNLFKRIRDYWQDKQPGISLANDQMGIVWKTAEEKEEFLNWLEDRRIKFDSNKPVEEASFDPFWSSGKNA